MLLLDDVFSELDAHRAAALVERLPPGQVLLTTAVDRCRRRCHAGRVGRRCGAGHASAGAAPVGEARDRPAPRRPGPLERAAWCGSSTPR